jgi:hypothetical protein
MNSIQTFNSAAPIAVKTSPSRASRLIFGASELRYPTVMISLVFLLISVSDFLADVITGWLA